MFKSLSRTALAALVAPLLAIPVQAQQTPVFTPGNLVVVVEGCGVHGGTCTAVKNGTGAGTGNSSTGGYGDNQAAPLTLFQYKPTAASSATFVNSLVLPQTASGANLPVSGEYGSSSEGSLQLSGTGQYLTLMGYGIDVPTFNAAYYPIPGFTGDLYGAAPSGALAQSGSLTGQAYTPVPRVITFIDPYGNVNSSNALYNVFNTNNPRSIYTADGLTSAYVSGQGSGCDATGGVFYTKLGGVNNAPTAITGIDAAPSSSCSISPAQDTRAVQIYNNTLYVSVDSTEGKSFNRSFIGTLGTPPNTSLYTPPTVFPYATGPTMLSGFGNTGGTGKQTITSGANSTGNGLNTGLQVNLSPMNYFFASPAVLYVADGGNPKQSSANSPLGDGGLQKWTNSKADGSGTWSLAYTLYKGLSLVANNTAVPANTTGATGLYGLAGTVVNGTAYLYATNYNLSDLDTTYLYGIADTLTTTTNPGTTFALLDTAPADSNFKGVSFAPTVPAGGATITSSPSGLAVTTAGIGCVPGTYTTPVTLTWTPGSTCNLSVAGTQAGPSAGTQYSLAQWQDGNTGTVDTVTAPTTSAVYNATYSTNYLLTTTASAGGSVSSGGYIAAGANAIVTATPATGFYFVNFTGATTSTTNPLSLPMTGPLSIMANFAAQTAPTVTFTGAPATASQFSTFTVATTSTSTALPAITASGACTVSGNTVTISAATGACQLTATWAASGSFLGATATQTTNATAPTALASLSASSLTFAPQLAGSTSAAQTITLSNTGHYLLSITSIATTGTFAQTNNCGAGVIAGTSCTISVTFAPTTTGAPTGTLTVTDNASNSAQQTATLTGTPEIISIGGSTGLTISAPGASATATLQIGQTGGFTGTVNLNCVVSATGSPATAPTCSLNPTQVQVSGTTAASSTLTINSTATASLRDTGKTFPFGGTALAGLFVLAFIPRKKARTRKLLALLFAAGLATAAIGCGTGNAITGTSVGTYNVTVTGTTASTTFSTTIPLSVQ